MKSAMCPDHTAVVGKVDKLNGEITFVQHGNAIHEKILTFDVLNGDVSYEQVIVIHMEPEFQKQH